MTSRGSLVSRTIAGWILLGVGSALAGSLAQITGLPAAWLVEPMLVAVVLALAWPKHPTVPRWGSGRRDACFLSSSAPQLPSLLRAQVWDGRSLYSRPATRLRPTSPPPPEG